MAVFPLDIRTELNIGGTWLDISPDVYVRDAKQITRGLRDQGSTADPSSLSMTLNNRAGKYSPRNAMSPLFGSIGRNTQVRVSVPDVGGDNFLQLDGDPRHFCSTPDTASLDITGDLDVRAEIAPNWYGADNQLVIGKWDRDSRQQSWVLHIAESAAYFHTTTGGDAEASSAFYFRALPQLPERAAIRVTLDVDNGNDQREVRFYWSTSLDGAWTQFGNPVYLPGAGSVFSGSAPLQIGITDTRQPGAATRYPMVGKAYRFEVRNGINGPVVAAPDFRNLPAGSTSFTDSAGRPWTVSPGAEIRDRSDRFIGEISEWPLRWTPDDVDVWTSVTASGVMRRLGQGQKALDSTLRRRIPSGKPTAYWPMEESQQATRAYSPIPGCQPASITGVEWASWDTLPSSGPLPRLTEECGMSAPVPAATPGQWQVEFVYNADQIVPTADAEVIRFTTVGSTVSLWTIAMRTNHAQITGYTTGGFKMVDQGLIIGADVFNGWTRLRFWAQDSTDGPTGFTWRIGWQDVGGDEGGLTRTVAAGSCGAVSVVAGNWPAELAGWGFGHLSVLPTANNGLYDGSDDAYIGETAWERMVRLSKEEGLPVSRIPGRLPVEAVGYQRADSLLSLFEAAADGDGGMLTEDPDRIALRYRDRSSLYTQAPALTLSYVAPGLGPDIDPVDDDSDVANDVTVTRDGGSSARAVQSDGPLGVDTIGRYDTSYTLSLATDEQVEPVAYWDLHLGTYDAARYPSVTIVLHKPGAESLIPGVLGLREGDMVRLTNLPEWVSHDDVDLIVCGWTEVLDLYRWEVTLNCAAGGPWNTAVTDHPTYGKADTDGSVVSVAAAATATKLIVRTTAGPLWTADPAELPYYIRVSGEQMRVNAVTQSVADAFTRTTANGWGTADSGGAWVRTGGADSEFSTNGTVGRVSLGSVNVSRYQTVPAPSSDIAVQCDVSTSVLATGGSHYYGVVARMVDSNNLYVARLAFNTSASSLSLTLQKRVGGTQTDLMTATVPGTYSAGAMVRLKLDVTGSTLRAKAWLSSAGEPDWQATVNDTSLTAAGSVGVRALLSSANTNTLPVTASFDNFSVLNSQAFTVDRSVNGVVKPQSVGTAVNIANPAITSL